MTRIAAMSVALSLTLMAAIPSEAQPLTSKTDVAGFARGNTLLVISRGFPTFIYLEPAGTYIATVPRGLAQTRGDWWVEGNRLCVRQTTPAPQNEAKAHCLTIASRAFEETWQIDDARNGADGKLTYQWLRGRTLQLPK